jgi:HEPN domain-containing protein
LEEAGYLNDGGFYTGAVYLAGHAVECMLKALLISRHPPGQRHNVYKACRQKIGHNLEELNRRLARIGARIPPSLDEEYATVLTWANEMRYEPGDQSLDHAEGFLNGASRLLDWAERSASW